MRVILSSSSASSIPRADLILDCRFMRDPYVLLGRNTGDSDVVQRWIERHYHDEITLMKRMILGLTNPLVTGKRTIEVVCVCLAGVCRSRGTKLILARELRSYLDELTRSGLERSFEVEVK